MLVDIFEIDKMKASLLLSSLGAVVSISTSDYCSITSKHTMCLYEVTNILKSYKNFSKDFLMLSGSWTEVRWSVSGQRSYWWGQEDNIRCPQQVNRYSWLQSPMVKECSMSVWLSVCLCVYQAKTGLEESISLQTVSPNYLEFIWIESPLKSNIGVLQVVFL